MHAKHLNLALDIRKQIAVIDKQIAVMDEYAADLINLSGEPRTAQHLMTSRGDFSIVPLLQAKSNLLLALATLAAS